MTIILSPGQLSGFGENDQITRLLGNLDAKHKGTLRKLTHVLCPPFDSPRLIDVIGGAYKAVRQYRNSLVSPNEDLMTLIAELDELSSNVTLIIGNHGDQELHEPLMRRLRSHPAWALCIAIYRASENSPIQIGAGVEIAFSIFKEKPFPKGYANDLRVALNRSSLNSEPYSYGNIPTYTKHLKKVEVKASNIFDISKNGEIKAWQSFERRVIQHLLRKQKYAEPKHRQGVLDQRHQSRLQLLMSSSELCEKAKCGDQISLLIILSFCCGISAELANDLPILPYANDEWIIAIDVNAGLIKSNIEHLYPDSALPSGEMKERYRAANKIVVKPIPQFIASLLMKGICPINPRLFSGE